MHPDSCVLFRASCFVRSVSCNRNQESGDRKQETGNKRQESGDRNQETGIKRQESRDRNQESGNRRQESGIGNHVSWYVDTFAVTLRKNGEEWRWRWTSTWIPEPPFLNHWIRRYLTNLKWFGKKEPFSSYWESVTYKQNAFYRHFIIEKKNGLFSFSPSPPRRVPSPWPDLQFFDILNAFAAVTVPRIAIDYHCNGGRWLWILKKWKQNDTRN